MDVLSNIGRSITGRIEKARLTLYDYRFLDDNGQIDVAELEGGKKRVTVKGLALPGTKNQGAFADLDKIENEAAAKLALGNNVEMLKRKMMVGGASAAKRSFIVKFNPSTISLQGTGGGLNYVMNIAEPKDQNKAINFEALAARIQFGVELIFDTTGAYEGVKKVGGAIAGSVTGKKETVENSVRMQVEGFVAALRHPRTRMLEFSWGQMSYRGTLNTLNIQYTMFSPEGYPVRARVNFGMTLLDEEVYGDRMGRWEDKVKKTFKAGIIDLPGISDKTAITNNVSPAQHVSSLLNLSL